MPYPAKHMLLLNWIAPRTEHKRLIANNTWLPGACDRAVALFEDRTLHGPAIVLSSVHEAVIDYLTQAPALVLAAAGKSDLALRDDRQRTAARFKTACSVRPRLRDLMRHYGLAPQLRVLSGRALLRKHHRLLKPLSDIPPSRLAQCIPTELEEQVSWLSSVDFWRRLAAQDMRESDWFVSWAAANGCHRHLASGAIELIDFASRNRAAFNTDWSFDEAFAASNRWHDVIALRPFEATCTPEELAAVADYGPMPDHAVVDGFLFVALRTRPQLFEEGRVMSHCVATYADRVFGGASLIYSVRQGEQRVATLELRERGEGYSLAQIKARRNGPAPAQVSSAAVRFVADINAALEVDESETSLAV